MSNSPSTLMESSSSTMSSSSSTSCFCPNCPQDIRILIDESTSTTSALSSTSSSMDWADILSYHATKYLEENPHITISIKPMTDLENQLINEEQQQEEEEWDASIVPFSLVGSLMDHDYDHYHHGDPLFWDLGPFIESSSMLEWNEILPFFRDHSTFYHEEIDESINNTESGSSSSSSSSSKNKNKNKNNGGNNRGVTKFLPLGGDVLAMYYRKDLFEEHNVTIPRTWEEYNEAAAFFHGQPFGPNGSPLFGSCISRINNCHNPYWTFLILSSMTQTMGTSSGFLLDPKTMRPLLGPAMEETLRIMREQMRYGHNNELNGECGSPHIAFSEGMCALTYNWGEQITVTTTSSPIVLGIAPTPGSTKVLDRETQELVDCTETTCPYGTYYEGVGIVNRPLYSARGGWMAGINNNSSESQKYAVADFLAYVSNSRQSLGDILPNSRSSLLQPYRYDHVRASNWIENENGLDPDLALDYSETLQKISSDNSVLEIRIPSGDEMRDAVDYEVFFYLMQSSDSDLPEEEDLDLRRQATIGIRTEIIRTREGVSGVKLSRSYRSSIGIFYSAQDDLQNHINKSFRDAAWGLSGLMCVMAVFLMIWTFRHRNNRVMKAFQPFLLIQSCAGLLLMSLSIIPLGYDDSSPSFHGPDLLNVMCMLAPWLYVVGFTLFFASVYGKIKECRKIYRNAKKCDVLLVKPASSCRLTVRLLILNGVLLGLWTGSDPLKWERRPVDGGIVLQDGTVETYGSCHGGTIAFGFAVALYLVNMTEVLIASIQAFKCRFLVLEYNEMQWLPLSVFPFFEVWIIGGPILPLIHGHATTVTFMLLSMMIVASTGVGGMAVFAPKDWYIRKFYHASAKRDPAFPERTSSAGIMVLQHPTVESQKQIEVLSGRLGQIEGWNIELEIEIRMMKEKFREFTKTEKYLLRESLLYETSTDTKKPVIRNSVMVEEEEDLDDTGTNGKTEERDLEAMEQFERIWKMPDDDDDDYDGDDERQHNETEIEQKVLSRKLSLRSLQSSFRSSHHTRDSHTRDSSHTKPPPAESAPIVTQCQATPRPSMESGSRLSWGTPDDMIMEADDENDMNDQSSTFSVAEILNIFPIGHTENGHDNNSAAADAESDRGRRVGDSPSAPIAAFRLSHENPRVEHNDNDDDDDYYFEGSDEHPEDEQITEIVSPSRVPPRPESSRNQQISHSPSRAMGVSGLFSSPRPESSRNQQIAHSPFRATGVSELLASPRPESSRNQSARPSVVLDEDLTEQELIRQIIELRLAAIDSEGHNDSVQTSPEDPLERLMKMIEDENIPKASITDLKPSPQLGPSEQEREKALIARIIALRLVAVDREAEGGGPKDQDAATSDPASRVPEDPLERIMNLNAEDRLISAIHLKRYEDPIEEESDEGEDAIVHNKDIRDLSHMIQENDLDELEKAASMLAESVKAKLTVSHLADLSHDTTIIPEDDDMAKGYMALAIGGGQNKNPGNTPNISMTTLDLSKISDDSDRRFVSMSDSILDSPERGGGGGRHVNGFGPSLLAPHDSPSLADSRNSGHLRAGQSSGVDPGSKNRKGLSSAAAAALEDDKEDYATATQFAGEPSQGENGRHGFAGWNGKGVNGNKDDHNGTGSTMGDQKMPFRRSPLRQGKKTLASTPEVQTNNINNNKSYTLSSDWAAVGGLANLLADYSDSQSATSYTGSNYAESTPDQDESVRSFEPPFPFQSTSPTKPIRFSSQGFVPRTSPPPPPTPPPPPPPPLSSPYDRSSGKARETERHVAGRGGGGVSSTSLTLVEKRQKKRELEAEADAWRESISKSFTK